MGFLSLKGVGLDNNIFIEVGRNGRLYSTHAFSYQTVVFFNWKEFIHYLESPQKKYQAGFIVGKNDIEKLNRLKQYQKEFNLLLH